MDIEVTNELSDSIPLYSTNVFVTNWVITNSFVITPIPPTYVEVSVRGKAFTLSGSRLFEAGVASIALLALLVVLGIFSFMRR